MFKRFLNIVLILLFCASVKTLAQNNPNIPFQRANTAENITTTLDTVYLEGFTYGRKVINITNESVDKYLKIYFSYPGSNRLDSNSFFRLKPLRTLTAATYGRCIFRQSISGTIFSQCLQGTGNTGTGKINLSGRQFDNVDFHGLDFSDYIIIGANFGESNLTDCNFARAILIDCNFADANLTRVNFSGANLKNTIFVDATLTNAVFYGAYISNANFEDAIGIDDETLSIQAGDPFEECYTFGGIGGSEISITCE